VKAAAGLADEIVRPIPALQAVIVQAAAQAKADGEQKGDEQARAALFCWTAGVLLGRS